MTALQPNFDHTTFRRYAGLALPRHVSYPMPTWWEDVTPEQADDLRRASRARPGAPDLSLYVHIPFCEKACRYCACTRVTLAKCEPEAAQRVEGYVSALTQEIRALGELLGDTPMLRQIHWGGGTPTYLDPAQITYIHDTIAKAFRIAPDAEIAMELDPRVTTRETLRVLRDLGFNRASFGVQDFDARVQEHVRRIQPVELVQRLLDGCRAEGFGSVNFDLIYGLPYQTLDTVRQTLETTIALRPDRIAYYQYAQIPDKIAEQRGLDNTQLPDSAQKLAMYLLGQEMLQAAGYVFIGLDHFALPDEPLAVALQAGTLQRNFQGMTTGGGLDLYGVGASAISHLARVGFLQNRRGVDDYVRAMQAGGAAYRGKRLTADDIVRQAVIREIYCQAEIRPAYIAAETGVDFDTYFARELTVLEQLIADGLLERTDDGFAATDPLGRVLLRTIGAVFDAYLAPDAWRVGDRQYFSANA